MLRGGFRGEILAVSSDDHPVAGVPTAATLADIEGRVDLAVVSVPTRDLAAVVIDVAHRGAHGMVVLTGTDFRVGDNRTIINLARAYGVRALGPDALGLINTAHEIELNATPGPMPRPGGVGLFCQSAAVGVALLNHAVRQDLGLSSFISTGDYADVTANDVMQYWEDDEATRVCLLSLDSIGNPRKFSRITRRLARRKPVVVFAPGRTHRTPYGGSADPGSRLRPGGRRALPAGRGDGGAPSRRDDRHRQDRHPAAAALGSAGADHHELPDPGPADDPGGQRRRAAAR